MNLLCGKRVSQRGAGSCRNRWEDAAPPSHANRKEGPRPPHQGPQSTLPAFREGAQFKDNYFAKNVKRFRGGLVCKAHRRLYHSSLGLRIIKKKERSRPPHQGPPGTPPVGVWNLVEPDLIKSTHIGYTCSCTLYKCSSELHKCSCTLYKCSCTLLQCSCTHYK